MPGPLPPNPDPQNILEHKSGNIEIYPSTNLPPSGTIVARPPVEYADGQGFFIDDGAGHGPIPFIISVSAAGVAVPPGGHVVDLSQATDVVKVGEKIAAAIDAANAAGTLFIDASADPNDGRVYLAYDFGSDLASDGNAADISDAAMPPGAKMPAGSLLPWVPGGPSNDVRNIQWAIEHIELGQTIELKQHPANDAAPYPFQFGRIGRLSVDRNVHLAGEVESSAPRRHNAPGGWILSGTTISGGTQMIIGGKEPVEYSLTNLIFDGFYAGAIRVWRSYGKSTISGCRFVNFIRGTTVGGGVRGSFPIVADGGTSVQAADECGGSLKVSNNYFGRPVAGTDPPAPDDHFNNLMHFSNCALDLEISHNEIEDCTWAGFIVFGNTKPTTIQYNTITKTKSFFDGAAIAIGAMTVAFDTPDLYTERCVVRHNRITIGSPNSSAIVVVGYPRDLKSPPVRHQVIDNEIVMNAGKAALACRGDCSNTTWRDNKVTGTATVGIWVTHSVQPSPFAPLPAGDTARPSHNLFDKNHLEQFTGSLAEVLVEDAEENQFDHNDFGEVGMLDGTHRGLAGAYVRRSRANTFQHEQFWGDYPGLTLAGSGPVPCVWIAAGAIDTGVSALRHDTGKPGADTCSQVFCWDATHNDIAGYEACPVVPAPVFAEMAAKELLAENVILALSGH